MTRSVVSEFLPGEGRNIMFTLGCTVMLYRHVQYVKAKCQFESYNFITQEG